MGGNKRVCLDILNFFFFFFESNLFFYYNFFLFHFFFLKEEKKKKKEKRKKLRFKPVTISHTLVSKGLVRPLKTSTTDTLIFKLSHCLLFFVYNFFFILQYIYNIFTIYRLKKNQPFIIYVTGILICIEY